MHARGTRFDHVPADQRLLARAVPVYEELPGWESDISGVRELSDLPKNARRYVGFLGEITQLEVGYLGVGPGRESIVPMPVAGAA